MTTANELDEPLDVLAFGPHPDDVELCCGGTLAVCSARGYRVGVVDLTRGELATNGTPETRALEAARASEVLGLVHRENLGLPDGGVSPDSVGPVVEVLRRLRPELVLAPWRSARHPDHEAAHALVRRAVFLAGVGGVRTEPPLPRCRPRRVLWYPMRVEVSPTLVVDVSSAHARKMDAIRCYDSQVSRAAGDAPTTVNDPRGLRFVEARDRVWGAHLGVEHGEAFIAEATLGVADPVAFFRDNPSEAPLLLPERG